MPAALDEAALRDLVSGPGVDTRTWVSIGIVDLPSSDEGGETVDFDEDDGQVYVNVTLKPKDTPVRARLGMLFAGPGETTYVPFAGGEEVIVVLPEGDPRTGAVILGRLNNAYDSFPFENVGGADPKNNAIAMLRTRTALTVESGASVLVRSAATGALLLLSGQGSVTLRDGSSNVLQMSPDVFGFQNKDGDVVLQLDLVAQRYTMQIGQAMLTLTGNAGSANPQSVLQAPSTFAVTAGGQNMNTAVEHVLTTEAFANFLAQAMNILSVQIAGLGAPLAALAPLFADPTFATTVLTPAIAAAKTSPQNQAFAAALFSAFGASTLKPPGVPGFGQLYPGIGCGGFLAG